MAQQPRVNLTLWRKMLAGADDYSGIVLNNSGISSNFKLGP
jgi:hypothetical protein